MEKYTEVALKFGSVSASSRICTGNRPEPRRCHSRGCGRFYSPDRGRTASDLRPTLIHDGAESIHPNETVSGEHRGVFGTFGGQGEPFPRFSEGDKHLGLLRCTENGQAGRD